MENTLPIPMQEDEMRALQVGDLVYTLPHGVEWKVISVETDGIEAEHTNGTMSMFLQYSDHADLRACEGRY